ncbi:hypothetical protein SS47_08205 [Enterobacter kobei]|nr:hypothetical protein A4308_03500 [Enterobacter sp. ODB01]KJL59641.1 hypothetical protein SS47_08205 [Enterobacter kobei]KUQ74617.1 hypothetical protein AWI26_19260 [Enterobacter kobei]
MKNRGGTDACLMLHIVAVRGYALNAHSCQCLAHFYRALEKRRESAQTVKVGKRTWSNEK